MGDYKRGCVLHKLMGMGSLLGSFSGTILNYKGETYVHC